MRFRGFVLLAALCAGCGGAAFTEGDSPDASQGPPLGDLAEGGDPEASPDVSSDVVEAGAAPVDAPAEGESPDAPGPRQADAASDAGALRDAPVDALPEAPTITPLEHCGATCNGCCQVDGTCQQGSSASFCGGGCAACVSCATACIAGACAL